MSQSIENQMEAGMMGAGTVADNNNNSNRGNISFDDAFILEDSSLEFELDDDEEQQLQVKGAVQGTVQGQVPIKKVSLFIPRVFPSVTEKKMKDIFHSQQIGDVERVDFIEKTDKFGKKYKNAYLHFNQWYSNKTSDGFRARVCAHPGAQARIVYDDPWYWTVLENTYTMVEESDMEAVTLPTTPLPTSVRIIPTQLLKRALGIPTTISKSDATAIIIDDDESKWYRNTNIRETTNLVSEDYVKHIEEMNADLLDRIQELEKKLSQFQCEACEKEKNRIYLERRSGIASEVESVEEQYFEMLRGK